ncbi:MAG: recombinase family protein [Rhodobacteraceae bacterium]|nr:recombinase family protein [Paracoccaceae bacterium]MCZ8083047.1 recombinase family protein [Paracoccaceae bacterium]
MKVGYKRVSSNDQSLERQELVGIEKTFEEKESGKDRNRPALRELIAYVRENDEVVVHSIDRLGRSLIDLESIVSEITAKGASISFLKERLRFDPNSDDALARFQFQIMAAFAEFERQIIRQRQKEGITKAKERGVYKGRPITHKFSLSEARRLRAQGLSYAKIADQLKCSVGTLHKNLKQSAA